MQNSLVAAVQSLDGLFQRRAWEDASLVLFGFVGILVPIVGLIRNPRVLWETSSQINYPVIVMLSTVVILSAATLRTLLLRYEFRDGKLICRWLGDRISWVEDLSHLKGVKLGPPAQLRRIRLTFSTSKRTIWPSESLLHAIAAQCERPNNSLERSRER